MARLIARKIILLLLFVSIQFPVSAQEDPVAAEFADPSQEYQPRTWWRWVGGNISREGITRDLEEIRAKGMNGVTLFNLGAFYPEGDVRFLTPEWIELFNFSVEECARLGLDFSFQLCDGWGASGGPWVPEEHAMKVVTSSKKTVRGGSMVRTALPRPFSRLGYYEDLEVFAFPAKDTSPRPFQMHEATIRFGGWVVDSLNLVDGNRYTTTNFGFGEGEEQVIDLEFDRPVPVAAVNVHQGDRETPVGPAAMEILWSGDGITFDLLGRFELDDIRGGTTFPEVSAKYFRLRITEWTPRARTGAWAFLSEIELLSEKNLSSFPALGDFELKAAVWHRRRAVRPSPRVPTEQVVKSDEVINLTSFFQNDTLTWTAPPGQWDIVRTGVTLTGKQNGPATDEGRGLECDKLSKEAVGVFFDGYAGKMLQLNTEHTGKTITRLFADSFEALSQNWTPGMHEIFSIKNGYELGPWLLALTGEVIDGVEQTEGFLADYRTTLSDLIAENYYAELNRLCHEHGVRFVAQAAGEQQMLANPILYSSKVDLPATEFWTEVEDGRGQFRTNGSFYDAVSASRFYGDGVIPTESFTRNNRDFAVTPRIMKPVGDKAFTKGVNQVEMHTYIHQPDESVPGWQHYMFGIAWGRKITWWEQAGELTKYQSRVQRVLQEGSQVADLLLFTGNIIPNSLEFAFGVESPEEIIPKGYSFDVCNEEVLLEMVELDSGMYRLPGGKEYRVLVLPPRGSYSMEAIRKMRQMVDQGGLVASRSMPGSRLEQVLVKEEIAPDFSYRAAAGDPEILFIHRRIGEADYYFLSNQEERRVTIEAMFRQQGKTVALWNPQDGSISDYPWYRESAGMTMMPMELDASESMFVVFRPGDEKNFIEIRRDDKMLYPNEGELKELPVLLKGAHGPVFRENGKYVFQKDRLGKKRYRVKGLPPEWVSEGRWTVEFDEQWGGPAEVVFDSLFSWTDHPMDGIRYYSGTAVYKKQVMLSEEQADEDLVVMLDLGKVRETAEVYVNGQFVSTMVFGQYTCELTGLLREGENQLEVHVTNTWNNRIAGDDLHPDRDRFTEYPAKGYSPNGSRSPYTESDLLESGLMGPVNIRFYGR